MNQLPHSQRSRIATAPGHGLMRGLKIEFFGLPGSGKTTVAREVHAALARRHPDLIFAPDFFRDEAGKTTRAAAKLRLILSNLGHDGGSRNAVRQTLAIQQPQLRDKLRAVSTVATIMAFYARLERHGMSAVLDQGLLQALWSVQLRALNGDTQSLMGDGLSGAVTNSRIYVSVATPATICADRLAARHSKHSRLQIRDATDAERTWEKAEFLRRSLLNTLTAVGHARGIAPRIITVDGTARPDETAHQIVTQLLADGTRRMPRRRMEERGLHA
ncbi:AAA family ATPase [Phaeobacter gallaeciensis]|uniref:AAA family ATPase n=1 Tax=Phaeobacter gallaeciensis TaxID=60890 RepID=UPI00237F332B|nr:AAA family ATPase [Phaeobacter gallaeciensis]MDE4191529.1 AAA family ATPase [Phaeobacter gallaeciensis]MDE4199992.1 AAA family ATPase [Phaeobacter gallaeciensis]MDE4204142.1 AAA family ATPase [Phaeobacter gallaeciensis]MDE4208284.1 AAA family ATPase [Phaeobacter gallaeciensis]MDE4216467.1 AAA family ATPase [Phaeobacter gallaeciensis]